MPTAKLLFTPGPLTTSEPVKRVMLRDLGSRDAEFLAIIRDIRRRLLEVGGVSQGSYEAVLMQGSGTFAVESVISSVLPRNGKLLVAVNGAYGRRVSQIAIVLGISLRLAEFPESEPVAPARISEELESDPAITHVAMVHCETSTGLINPVSEVGSISRCKEKVFIVDAMSSFGGIPLDVRECGIDFLVSSANKCIQGVPGFGFVIARRGALLDCEGYARSLSLDLLSQWKGLESNGQFRFTPPTHALLAFQQALLELEAEGGVSARASRYAANRNVLMAGMDGIGFLPYLASRYQSHIISCFRIPDHPNFTFSRFYQRLSELGFVIYPGKVSDADCFRIGTIGNINPTDMENLLSAIRRTLHELQVNLLPPQTDSLITAPVRDPAA